MIEIIREEDWDGTTEKKSLPKDIKQIGRPDIGDRIYVENQVYQFLHPYDSSGEKTAYVLLGRFENYAGKQCTFIEAAIRLEEMRFEGELPQWNDKTWAYIYKQLKHEYDSMVIVGWAMDIRGQLPNMTVRIEGLHRANFGGAHQILFLMDSLEKEEAFYGNRNGQLYRREGFYVYYDRTIPERVNRAMEMLVEEKQILEQPIWDQQVLQEKVVMDQAEERFDRRAVFAEDETVGYKAETEVQQPAEDTVWESTFGMEGEDREEKEEPAESGLFGQRIKRKGSYRQQIVKPEEKQGVPAYSSSLLLAVVVCVLGFAAYQNYQKMNAMQETLAQINSTQTTTETEQEQSTETGGIKIESVTGDIQRQEETLSSEDSKTETSVTEGQSEIGQDQNSQPDPSQNTEVPNQPDANANNTAAGDVAAGNAGEPVQNHSAPADTAAADNQDAASVSAEAVPTEAQAYLSQGYYIVQKGDSLAGICRKIYQTTVMMDKLCEINGIDNPDSIYAGQYLTLPN